MKYIELIPSVKWNCPSDNNKNVLVICHPQQIPYYLPRVKDYIWERMENITIWQTHLKIGDTEQFLKEIGRMDAIICFITELLLLTKNKIRDDLLAPIIESKCPFLPIVDGENLEKIFDEAYGHIHCIKCSDNKKIRFDVIEKFIKKIPSSKEKKQWFEISPQDVQCFSQSYFISYRKIDGKYVDYLQHIIHNDPSLVETQLWYDSYLVPGKNYETSLSAVITECSAVLLVITPHLLELDNYVLRVEIPAAKKYGKPVIGILMEETDLNAIQDVYGIEKIYRLEKGIPFGYILSKEGLTLPKTRSYPRRLFLLATAYMEGRIVEYNIKVACELLYQAIQYKYPDAYEKLIEIKTGEFEEAKKNDLFWADCLNDTENNTNQDYEWNAEVKQYKRNEIYDVSYKDINEAIRLFEEYIEILEDKYKQHPTEDRFISLLDALKKYCAFYLSQNMLKEAEKQLLVFYKYVKPLEKQKPNKLFTYLSVASLLLARTYNELEDYDIAELYYKKSVDIDRILNDSSKFNHITFTNLLTSLCDFGDFCQEHGKLLKAKIMFEEVLNTIQHNGAAYAREWDTDSIYHGFFDESSAQRAKEMEYFAQTALKEIETELMNAGKFIPTIKIYSKKQITDNEILKSCDGDEVQLLSHDIMINSGAKIHWLIDFLSSSDLEFDICQNKFCMDAKCMLSLMALDHSDVCQLVVHTTDKEKATKILFEIVKALN